MRKNIILMLAMVFCATAYAQPPGKLMCGPITFNYISRGSSNEFDPQKRELKTTNISFYEDDDGGFLYIENEDKTTEIIPLEQQFEIRPNKFDYYRIIFKANRSDWHGGAVMYSYKRYNVGFSADEACLGINWHPKDQKSGHWIMNIVHYVIPHDVHNRSEYSNKSKKLLERYNTLADYFEDLKNENRSGFFKLKGVFEE